MRARAFAPGHVSGLFAVHDEAADPGAKGSRGAGWSVGAGATATVERASRARITIDGQVALAPVTNAALAALAPGVALEVDLRLGLPVGQGFGMSAAGTLAACLAATNLLDLEPEEALVAAHAAEVAAGTGLGDAIGSWHGGGEIRLRPGIPPHGWAMRIEPEPSCEIVYCVVGAGIPTPRIIRDAAWVQRTRQLADPAVDRIAQAGRVGAWEHLLDESAAFSQALGLASPALQKAGAVCDGRWGQCMLGNTLWAENHDGLAAALAPFGQVLRPGFDLQGARMTR